MLRLHRRHEPDLNHVGQKGMPELALLQEVVALPAFGPPYVAMSRLAATSSRRTGQRCGFAVPAARADAEATSHRAAIHDGHPALSTHSDVDTTCRSE